MRYPVAMRRHRFIVPGLKLAEDRVGIRDEKLVHQLRAVLRVRPGDEIVVSDGAGAEAVATLEEYKGDAVTLRMEAPRALDTEPAREVVIFAAVTKRDTFEWACQKATECGATRIVPVITERTVKPNVNLVRLRAIVKEAAEQCGRARVPEIGEIVPFVDAILERDLGCKLIASTAQGAELIAEGDEAIAVLVGPEGGFSDREIAEAVDAGWAEVSLGSRVLRAETAVAIAAYLASR